MSHGGIDEGGREDVIEDGAGQDFVNDGGGDLVEFRDSFVDDRVDFWHRELGVEIGLDTGEVGRICFEGTWESWNGGRGWSDSCDGRYRGEQGAQGEDVGRMHFESIGLPEITSRIQVRD